MQRSKDAKQPTKSTVDDGESWYDYPQYFDMALRDETKREVQFIHDAISAYAQDWQPRASQKTSARETAHNSRRLRLYEPGCGSGRLVAAMAARGHSVVALDNNQSMLDYVARRVGRSRRIRQNAGRVNLVRADMASHVCRRQVDAAFCTFNTFRHLTTGTRAKSHLRSVADSLRSGGLYILGFHCLPLDVDPDSIERWTAVHGQNRVTTTFRVIQFNRRQRIEHIRVSVKATNLKSGRTRRIRSEFPLRLYTPHQAKQSLASLRDVFDVVAIHDFDYDISQKRQVDDDLIDAVFVLRRRQR
ncbi:MAG: class I SAM-dependent methyltransferase [Planctomycetota bacterium]